MLKRLVRTVRYCFVFFLLCLGSRAGAAVDLRQAVVTSVGDTGRAVEVLIEEVDRRAQVLLAQADKAPPNAAAIVIGTREDIGRAYPSWAATLPAPAAGAEGFSLAVAGTNSAPVVLVAGNDKLGVLFGVGKLLQHMQMDRQVVSLPEGLSISSAPHYALRGHQLGYRPKTNSYDGWDVPQWDQYIRELALFGTNAIELIPPKSDDAADSPHFPLPPLRMMREMARIIDSYGLQCWVWFPALEKDYTDSATMQRAIAEWEEVFRELPRIDAIFVPGGDPGHTEPAVLMTLLAKQTEVLKKFHPKATMWVSPQGFSADWMEEFYQLLATDSAWLTGIVFGPQNRADLTELRKRIPARLQLRHYPDITHTMRAQFAVPDWDVAYALTLQREPINPRPYDQAAIIRKVQPLAEIGFLAYSEGCNDDVNKFVWSALGWDPEMDVLDALRNYSRLFIGPSMSEGFAQGLVRLEQNWRGPLLANAGVETTLAVFREMEARATPRQRANWRFQQVLYRAYYDAYTRVRLIDEQAREARALGHLRAASALGLEAAMDAAEQDLRIDAIDRAGKELRARVFELAEALFQSIRMQLSVARYQAISVGRGANLDLIDMPLNNTRWLTGRFAAIRRESDSAKRMQMVNEILHWTSPGPGGFYDDLGDPGNQPHLVRGPSFADDPTMRSGPTTGFSGFRSNIDGRMAWWRVAETLYERPLEMRYEDLEPTAQYRVRVIYGGDANRVPLRLEADGKYELHPLREKDSDFTPVEALIPREATVDGTLTLRFNRPPGLGGNGRGVQVAEVWLVREDAEGR